MAISMLNEIERKVSVDRGQTLKRPLHYFIIQLISLLFLLNGFLLMESEGH